MGKWEMVWLGDVCDVLNGFAFQSTNYISNGHRVIRITNVQKGAIVDDDPKYYNQSPALDKYELYDNDLLMSLTGNVGRVGLISENMLPAYLNQRVACLREKTRLLSKKFLYFYLNADDFERDAINSSKGLAQKNMSTEWLKNYAIPLPPLPVQRKIADVLDRASALIEKRKAQIDKLDLLVKSQFIEMFGDPMTNPKRWEVKKLGDVFDIGSSKRIYQSEQTASGVPFYRISDLMKRIDNLLFPNDLFISNDKYDNLQVTGMVPKCGDILVTSRGTLGQCYVLHDSDKFYFQDGMISWLKKGKVDVESIYIKYLFMMKGFRKQIDEVPDGSTVNYLSIDRLNRFNTIYPDYILQCRFAAFVQQVEKKKTLLQQSLAKLEINYKHLIQKCFRGEIF